MQETYKAIDNKLFVFGMQPFDIVLILVGFLFVHGIISSLMVDVIYVILAVFVAKKVRNRPENIFVCLYLYFITPPELVVESYEFINNLENIEGKK
jgi:hypothetical protein